MDNANEMNTDAPLLLLFCTDLMFGVQLQKMATACGWRHRTIRPGMALPPADLMVVDLGSRAEWEAAIHEAVFQGIRVVAFGPHMDSAGRRRAKEAGAYRVLANSNLTRDLPTILSSYHSVTSLSEGTNDQEIDYNWASGPEIT